MDILYITNIPSPYVVEFLDELGKKANVMAVFERLESSERDKSWREFNANHFEYKILRGIKYSVDKAICPNVIGILKKYRNRRIIISNPITITGIIAISWLKRNHIPYALQVEGGFHKDGKGIVEAIKKYCFTGASHYYSSGKATDDYLLFYGADEKKISYYPFTSIHENDVLKKTYDNIEKSRIRMKLGIPNGPVIIAVGRIVHDKGFDVLIKALSICSIDYHAYFIGGRSIPEFDFLCAEKQVSNITYIDFLDKESLYQWMICADLLVMPTRRDVWGLVINEAFACGLPVISSDACIAGIEMIKPGVNGYIFRSEDYEELAYYICRCLDSTSDLTNMSSKALETAREYTYEKMADAHLLDW